MIRVNAYNKAGRTVPFSIFYLVKEENLEYAEKAFQTFFGFKMSLHSFDWGDVVIGNRRDTVQNKKNNKYLGKKLKDIIDMSENWHVIIPFISREFVTENNFKSRISWRALTPRSENGTSRDKKRSQVKKDQSVDFDQIKNIKWKKSSVKTGKFLVYDMANDGEPQPSPIEITHPKWERKYGEPFPESAYLKAKDGYHQPICAACPRQMLHEQGECEVGDPICYLQLRLYDADTFVSRYRDYQDIKKLCESVETKGGDHAS